MKTIYKYIVLVAVLISMASCDRIEILSPPGPRGLSAYEVWVEAVQNKTIQWENGTDLANYFKYLKGAKGDSGKDAFSIWQDWIRDGSVDNPHKPGEKWNPERNTKRDFYLFLTGAKGDKGDTPFINSKGNWQIGNKDTGIPARGKDGKKGDKGDQGEKGDKGDQGEKGDKGDQGEKGDKGDQGEKGDKGDQGEKGDKGDQGEKGDKGDQGEKGDKGDQGEKGDKGDQGKKGDKGDQGKKGDKGNQGQKGEKGDKGNSGDKGDKGNDGASGAPGDKVEIIGGYWYINGINTGVPAVGEKGDPGKGKSAYEIWVEEVEKGTIFDKDGNVWDKNNKSMAHFMLYMKGEKGGAGEVKVTPLSILRVIPGQNMGGMTSTPVDPEPPEHDPSPNSPTRIEVQSEPDATVYYQVIAISGAFWGIGQASDTEVYEMPVDDAGKATISVDIAEYDFFVNVWALSKGKAYSPNLFVRVNIFMPT